MEIIPHYPVFLLNAQGKANLLVKDKGIIAGVAFAKKAFTYFDEDSAGRKLY